MAPRKLLAKENASEEVKPLRVLRPKLQVASTNNSDNKMEEKVEKRKKATTKEPTESKAVKTASKPEPKAKAAPKPKKVAAKGHKLPDPIKPGTVFTDSAKQVWKVGKSLGSGGFGEVYSATDNLNEKIDNYKYVMKVEYSTGPLFVEQNFYVRCAKTEHLEAWKKEHKVKTIGLPTFYAMKGQQEHDGNSYRFIIITKFGQDLQHLLEEHKQFSLKNTITIGCSLINTLEYIHHSGYVHADLKPANILVGIDSTHAVVNIVDFGLATKYKDTDDNHKAHKVEKKAAHNGTLIYTSLVAHHGAVTTSRICDIEILAYNLLHFYTGSLPWASYEKQPDKVMKMKEELSEDPKKFLSTHYPSVPDMQVFVDLFEYIALSEFQDAPDYNKLKQMLTKALTKNRLKFDGKLNFDDKTKSNGSTSTSAAAAKKSKAAPAKGRVKKADPKIVELHSEEEEDDDEKDDVNNEDEEHIDDETLRFVNTNKRRVKATVAFNKLEEASEEDEEEEEPVKQKKKRQNAKEIKTAPTPAETAPPSPEPEPQPSSSEVLDETFTISNPTPAMVAVMKKQAEKKPGPIKKNKPRKNEKPEEKIEKHSEDEKYLIDTETYPTPAMVDVMKKKEEKIGVSRNNRANKDRITEKVEETHQVEEEIDMDTETPMSPVMKKKENKKPAARNKKITSKGEKVEFKPIKDKSDEENDIDTESNPTPAMIEVIKKQEEKKPTRNNRTTSKDEKMEEKPTKDKELDLLDEEKEIDTESNPTPAMIEVMKKHQEKKPTRNNRMTNKDNKVELKPIKDTSDEENDINTESNPTPAMIEVMKKQEEKKPTRNNRTTSKDEKIEEKITKDKKLDLLDEEKEIDTESNPTPAMMEVMKKKENKKPARNNRMTSKDVLMLEEKPIEDEENGIHVESNPTPAMLEFMKKKTARNNRTTSKDEKMDEEPHITTRRGKTPRLEEKEDEEDDVMGEEEDHEEEEPIKEDRKRKRGANKDKTDVPSVPDLNSTFTVLTPAMMEVINKKNERKAAASKAKK